MTISDKIQIVYIIITSIISVTSICIAVISIKQTTKITREANRPYIAIYYDSVNVVGCVPYIILRNFGKTGATIDSVSYSPTFEERHGFKPFTKLNNYFIAPNQKIATACDLSDVKNIVTFTVKYHTSAKTFSESFVINPDAVSDVFVVKSNISSESPLEKTISNTAQEIIRTNL